MSTPRIARSITERPPAGEQAHPFSRAEAVLVGLILLLGLALRGLRPDALAVEHFDEGVYASNLYCGHLDPPFAYPMRHLYAPPLFPALLEWAQILAGPPAVMWVNVLLGSLTVAAVWWTTRCWFGPAAALAAALLAATSEYHIAFSRMALTDVPLSLLMLLGVFAGWKAVLTGRPSWIVAGGLLAGLAWCTKYNGWLTLAVTGAGTAAWGLATRLGTARTAEGRKKIANCKLKEVGVRWGLTAVLAGVVFWLFVLRELGPLGGYAAVAKNHAGYFVGLGGWWSGLVRQAAAHEWIMGWPTVIGIAAAWLTAAWMARRGTGRSAVSHTDESFRENETRQKFAPFPGPPREADGESMGPATERQDPRHAGFNPREWIAVTLVIAALLSVSGLLAITALIGAACVLTRRMRVTESTAGPQLAAWMLLAWFVGLLVAVPLYNPYPRLSLPWVVACWPLAGAALAWIGEVLTGDAHAAGRESQGRRTAPALPIGQPWLAETGLGSASPRRPGTPIRQLWLLVVMAMVVGVPLVAMDSRMKARLVAWQPRELLAGIAQLLVIEIDQDIAREGANEGQDVEAVVYVLGDPAMFYQLATLCRARPIVVAPVAEAAGLRRTGGTPTFLVVHRSGTEPEPALPHRSLVVSSEFVPSDLVLLDRMPAGELSRGSLPDDVVSLYELRPGGY